MNNDACRSVARFVSYVGFASCVYDVGAAKTAIVAWNAGCSGVLFLVVILALGLFWEDKT